MNRQHQKQKAATHTKRATQPRNTQKQTNKHHKNTAT